MGDIKGNIAKMKKKLSAEAIKRQKLRNSQLFVLDNSLRESTVGQLRGHTLENKWKIYEEVGTALNGDHEGVQLGELQGVCSFTGKMRLDWRHLCRMFEIAVIEN